MYTRQNSLHFMLLTGFSLAGENAYVMPSLYYHPSAMKIITNKVKLSSYGRDSMHGTLIHIKNDRCVTWLLSLLGLKLLLKTATEIIPRESGCKILRKDVQNFAKSEASREVPKYLHQTYTTSVYYRTYVVWTGTAAPICSEHPLWSYYEYRVLVCPKWGKV